MPSELEAEFYDRWLSHEGEQRVQHLEDLCRRHPEHAATLRGLANDLSSSDQVLDRLQRQVGTQIHPKRIGAYDIVAPIGEGGFAVVYRAEQREPVHRTVALKLLHPGRLDARGLARFENERQALAVMTHPGIAHVFDAGTSEDGRPYFVMEFVVGATITIFCREHRLGLEQRLALFVQVCAAVQHAHQKGVVHRDLKPSNVLVTMADGEPAAKVIDFGVAKALDESAVARTLGTLDGALIGTPEYMSPEQAAGRPVDTRTDVYALGVLLFELLTGQLPFPRDRLDTSSLAEFVRIVCDEDPVRPSAALPADHSSALAARLRSDLDWVVLRCLEKDPAARYASATALAEDIERCLRHEPVRARQPEFVYVARKFVRRHRVGVGVGAFVLTVLTLGITGLIWALIAVNDARVDAVFQEGQAERERDRAVLHSYAAHVTAAKLAFEAGALGSAVRHLEDLPATLHGWEWRYVRGLCDTAVSRVDVGGRPSAVLWLDGRQVLVAQHHGVFEIWDLVDGVRVRSFGELDDVFVTWAVDLARGRLVTASQSTLDLWDLTTGTRIARLVERTDKPHALCMSPDHKRVACAGPSGLVQLIELDGERRVEAWLEVGENVAALEFTADGTALAVARASGPIQILDVADRRERLRLVIPGGEAADRLLRAGGRTLYASGREALHVFDLASGERVTALQLPDRANRLDVSADGSRLFAAGGWGIGFLIGWDTASWEHFGPYSGHELGVRGLALAPDGRRVATTSHDGTVRVWASAPTPAARRLDAGFDARTLARSPDGRVLATAAMDGSWRVWDAATFASVASGRGEPPLHACAVDDTTLYALTRDELMVIDLATGVANERSPWLGDQPRNAALGAQGRWLAVGSFDTIQIWSLPIRAPARVIAAPFACHCLLWDERAQGFLAGCGDGVLRVYDPATGEVVRTQLGAGPTSTDEVDPGAAGDRPIYRIATYGELFATASADGRVRVIERFADTPAKVLRGHEIIATGVAFSPDGRRLATAGGDGYVRIWDVASGLELLALKDGTGVAQDAGFTPDGNHLAVRYHIWSTPTWVSVFSAPPPGTPTGR